EGRHDYRIRTSGLIVFPRLVAADYRRERPHEIASSGLAALDELLGGGLEVRHDYRIRTSGLIVFPRLVAADYRRERPHEIASSGLAALDELLGGGLDRGSRMLLLGSRSSGKSSVAMQIAAAAAERGERVAIYLFDESTHIFFVRADRLGMPPRTHAHAGRVRVHSVDAGEWTPGEFAHSVRGAVENDGARVVVIDT